MFLCMALRKDNTPSSVFVETVSDETISTQTDRLPVIEETSGAPKKHIAS